MKDLRIRLLYLAVGVAAGVLVCLFAPDVSAHGGGKDGWGGHHVKATGEYHCHTNKATDDEKALCDRYAELMALQSHIESRVCPEAEVAQCPEPDPTIAQQMKAAETELLVTQELLASSKSAETAWRDRATAAERDVRTSRTNLSRSTKRVEELERQLRKARDGAEPCIQEREAVAASAEASWFGKPSTDATWALVRCLRGN